MRASPVHRRSWGLGVTAGAGGGATFATCDFAASCEAAGLVAEAAPGT